MVLMGLCWLMAAQAQSIDPVSMVIAKAIKAIDLKVQKLQNETLVLQGVQQLAEQELGKQQLAAIRNWQVQLSQLYQGYYAELKQVKSVFAGGAVVRKILSLQKELIVEYGRLGKTGAVKIEYDGLIENSRAIMQSLVIVLSNGLSMRDAERFRLLYLLKDSMLHCLDAMRSLNKRQAEKILHEAKMKAGIDYVKRLHGLQ